MDPVSLLVSALVSGILAGVTRSTQNALYEGYVDVKELILRRYGSRGGEPLREAFVELEAEPTVERRQAALAEELVRVGADQDPQLQRLADQLAALVEDPMQRFGSAVGQAHYQAGVRAFSGVMERHVGAVLDMRSRLQLEDTDLLTGNDRRRDVPREVGGEIERLHRDMRTIIHQIAQHIEDNNYRDAEDALQSMPMAFAERARAASLVQVDKRIHVSYLALKMAVEYFSTLNERLLEKIDTQTDPAREATMMLGNSIMIFELTAFVIHYVNNFTLDGEDELESLHRETKLRIESLRGEQNKLRDRALAKNIEPAVRDQTLSDIKVRAAAVDELEREWDRYLAEVSAVRSMIGVIHTKIPTLELIRDNARVQIGVLQLVAMLQFLKRNADAVSGTIETLKGFRLAPLSPSRVRRLIGVSQ